MPATTSRRRLTTAAVVVAVVAVLALVAWLLTRPDPQETVAPVVVDEVSAAPPVPGQAGPSQEQIEALDRLTGDLRHGGDTAEFVLDDVELDFGPDAWVLTAPATVDFDGNGTVEPLLAELEGLVGKPVTAMVRLDEDGDDADVFVVNEQTYRDSTGANLPWQPVETTGTPISAAVARTEAARAVGDGAEVTEIERVRAGRVAWEATVLDLQGVEHSVLLGADGAVLDLRRAD